MTVDQLLNSPKVKDNATGGKGENVHQVWGAINVVMASDVGGEN